VEFAGSDAALTPAQKAQYPSLVQMALVGGPNVLVHNVRNNSNSNTVLSVTLSRENVAAIYNNSIWRWDDPRILADNPTVAQWMPSTNITVVIRSDSSGTTNIQTSALAKFGWGLTTTGVDIFSGTLAARTWNNTQHGCRWRLAPQNFGVYATTLLERDSIGYVSYAFVISESVNIVAMKNKAGNILTKPDAAGITEAVDTAVFNDDGSANINDLDTPDAWPIVGFTYIIINTNRSNLDPERCQRRREMGKLLNWLTTDSWPASRASRSGFVMVSEARLKVVRDLLNTISCQLPDPATPTNLIEESLIGGSLRLQRQGGGHTAVLAVSMILFAFSVGIIAFFVRREWEKIPVPALIFAALLAVGAALSYVSVIVFYTIPYTTAVCEFRKWLVCFGFSLTLGAVFTKTLQINTIYRFAKRKTQDLSRGIRHVFIVSSSIFIVLLIQLILLTLWSSLDTWEARRISVDKIELIEEWACVSVRGQITSWLIVEIVFFLALCVFGIFVVYRTWEMKYSVMESKWLLISIYNVVLTLALIIPLIVLLKPNDDGLLAFTTIRTSLARPLF
jgi:ABC-type phosphate transport system substrate-binding protein